MSDGLAESKFTPSPAALLECRTLSGVYHGITAAVKVIVITLLLVNHACPVPSKKRKERLHHHVRTFLGSFGKAHHEFDEKLHHEQ